MTLAGLGEVFLETLFVIIIVTSYSAKIARQVV